MTTKTKATENMFEQAMDNFRKTAEQSLAMQQEMFRAMSNQWSVVPQTPDVGEHVRGFQRQFAEVVTAVMQKHREVLDQQYRAGIKSVEEAFRVLESKDPAQLRHRAEELCRKNLECVRETSEAQMRELQDAVTRWVELFTKPVA